MKTLPWRLVLGMTSFFALASCDQSSSMDDKPRRVGSKTTADSQQQQSPADEENTVGDKGDGVVEDNTTPPPATPVPFAITSSAFQNDQMMPAQYVAKNGGGNQSPPLAWTGVPGGTGSFAIQMVDLDFLNPAPSPFIHWVITDIPATTTALPVALPNAATLSTPAAVMGANQPRGAYRGPNPPNLHRYEFTIYAIKAGMTLTIGNDSVANRAELESKSLGKATIIGTYQ